MAQVTGSLISAVRDACRNGLLDWSPRLMLAMYECDIQASSMYLLRPDLMMLLTKPITQRTCLGKYMAWLLGDEAGLLRKR